ncbi:YheT family hydrolase [Maribacter sp. 2307ULW6-5]|uniref:YheT family hydrolase n=1 Tax=Maribacter sp. 2307ULW6-5 TaxID=3386275 RepID=UPI0039BC30F3
MPLVPHTYRPPLLYRNGHLSTMYAGLLRRVPGVVQQRERIDLPDGDFLDLDWSHAAAPTDRAVVLLHGLEGNAQRAYMLGAAKALNGAGYDVCAVNFRGCSGTPNNKYRSYHSGATEDLKEVITALCAKRGYEHLFLKGFSLGGNLILKYLGEGNTVPEQLRGAVAVSVPCQLAESLAALLTPQNALYALRFKKNLLAKLRQKQKMFPGTLSDADIDRVATLKDFDDVYTSRAHGFKDAMDYYARCSALQFLPNLKLPALVINAKNDSFLGDACYPVDVAREHEHLHLEMPEHGGHVGFYGPNGKTYSEHRAVEFFNSLL